MSSFTIPGQRKPSPACEAFVKTKETCRLKAFLPTPRDRPTIGWGSTAGIALGMVWTQEQADTRFDRDLKMFAVGVDHELGDAPTTQGQFDALVSFAYNVGLHNLDTSTLLRLHNHSFNDHAATEFAKWNKQKGQVLRGLTVRRAEEAAMYRAAA